MSDKKYKEYKNPEIEFKYRQRGQEDKKKNGIKGGIITGFPKLTKKGWKKQ